MNESNQYNELQQTLQEIYIKNLDFFKVQVPKIYKKALDFEKTNEQRYSIEYLNQEFQLFDKKTKATFYEKEPFSDSINRINNFNLSAAFSLVKLEHILRKNHYENEINSYLYINNFIDNFSNVNIKINKFIFIGTLLGVHINDFHKSIKAKSYLIIEPDFEIFRLSMFMTDYTELAKSSKLFFSIEEEETIFKDIIKDFLDYKYEYNNLIHYELAHQNNKSILDNLSLIFTQFGEMRYPFSEYIISLKRGYKYFFEEKRPIINLSKTNNFFKNDRVIFLGAGVSLAKNIEWLYLNHDKFIIVAASAVLKHLQILEIIPDIIIIMDGQKDAMIEQFNVKNYMYENSIILSSIKLDENLYEITKNTNIFFMQNSLELFEGFGFLSGITIGDIGVDILIKLGAKEIYLLGVDASIDSKTGKTHVGTHKSSKKINLNNIKNDKVDFQNNIVFVKGNFIKEVPTLLEYTDMIDNLNIIISNNKDINIYNLGDGAFFEGTTPLKPTEINVRNINKNNLQKELISNFYSISKKELSTLDKKRIQKEKEILKRLNSIDFKSDFIKDFCGLKNNFSDSIIFKILEKYFKLILPYANFLEDKNLSSKLISNQSKEILNNFNKIFEKINIK
ncbi:MAG: hypothetical protein C0625_09675 [Arcobacter sp.]|nr:MAG: hypothetical protein C0625_09675 [Arcobacter sp.]